MNEPRANMHGGTLQYTVAGHTYVIGHNEDVSVYAWGVWDLSANRPSVVCDSETVACAGR